MDTKNTIKEDQPSDINPKEIGKTEPAKELKSQTTAEIKESGLGRYQGQFPGDEHIETSISQIDKGTVKIQENKESSKEPISEDDNADEDAEGRDTAGYMNDINDTDDRDQNNSTADWDAENSKTGRHK
ncbi:hypothetical protein FNO01nite_25810 [Flavobacterium noncentrifugens]|uniref:Uncharacterized protein n=1 Tax=Flavobacterium noncentrifugens TaxID=1128970 RepID=A0A1G8ZPV5_9FLAO|nr:hypothetical protein [Flavobacterium noncentrifugens]GEP51909.1 hypothetical protein FNO01nite_25810 [Flavobacterium noncentrifugens]SDK16190.1 hypothetical protein SAMN04487935_2661 [Flavobacterium noncentrifugens]